MANATVQAKKTLRAAILKIKRGLPETQITLQSQQITNHVLESSFFKSSTGISCYLSIQGEVETTSLVLSILRAGKRLYVPKLDEGRLHMVRLYGEEDFRTLRSGIWGIKEPSWEWENKRRETAGDSPESRLDLMLVPGVAFDRGFARIGYGKGYYDRFLTEYKEKVLGEGSPLLAALSLREQLLETGKVPLEDHDRAMDMIVTADGILQPDRESQAQND